MGAVKTSIATLSQHHLWAGDLPPITEGSRIVIGPPGSTSWVVELAFIHLDGETPEQVLYVEEATVHDHRLREIATGQRRA